MNEKMKKYFELAYPGKSATPQAKNFFRENYSAIYKQIALAEFEEKMGTSTKGKVDGKKIQDIIRNVKVDKYFKMAYGDKENATSSDRDFISQNLGAIEDTYRERMQVNTINNRNMTKEEVLQEAIKLVKIKKYSKLALKGKETGFDEKKKMEKFIRVNFERINKCFARAKFEQRSGIDTNGYRETLGKTDEEIILGAIHDIKVDKYCELAYGDKEKATSNDRKIISENLDKIESYYEDCMRPESGAQQEGRTEQQIVTNAIKVAKAEKYFSLIHPEDLETLNFEEQKKYLDDRDLIFENIDEIDSKYMSRVANSGYGPYILQGKEGDNFDSKKVIQSIIQNISKENPVAETKKINENSDNITPKDVNLPINEDKFAEVYGKSKGKIKEIFSKIKSFFTEKNNDKTNDKNDDFSM